MTRVLHITPILGPRAYGPGPVVLNIAREQAECGLDPKVWCLEADPAAACALDGALRSFPSQFPRMLRYSPEMEKAVIRQHGRFDLLHQHGVFLGLSRVALRWRDASGGPTMITPHGCLSPVALRTSAWKKRLARIAYEDRNLAAASCIQALSENEIAHIRAFGLRNPIASIPNGIEREWLSSSGDGGAFRKKFGLAGDRRVVLYLSRIHPMKGLQLLVPALARVRRWLRDWLLVIAGSDECGYESAIRSLVSRSGLDDAVVFAGPQWGQDKRDAFAAAELFVLPSLSEAAPIALLEALGAAVPTICTDAVSLAGFERARCGWRTAVSAEGIALALEEALDSPPGRLKQMGARGRCLVETSFTWSTGVEKIVRVYGWLLGHEARPEYVLTD